MNKPTNYQLPSAMIVVFIFGSFTSLAHGAASCEPPDGGVWNADADGHTCGARIQWLVDTFDWADLDARIQVSGEFPAICGSCDDEDPTPAQTCQSVWNDLADGYTCGARIEWLQNTHGFSEIEAKTQVVTEFPVICGACNPAPVPIPAPVPSPTPLPIQAPTTLPVAPTPNPTPPPVGVPCLIVMNAMAGGHSCNGRVVWLVQYQQKSRSAAEAQVATEFPEICKFPCIGDGGNGDALESDEDGASDLLLTVATQNLYWWRLFDQLGGGNFFSAFSSYGENDIQFFQECDDIRHIRSGLGQSNTHNYYQRSYALAITWNKQRFDKLTSGTDEVGEDQPGLWGSRAVAWVRLREKSSDRTLWVGSHHGPLGINTGGRYGPAKVVENIHALVARTRQDEEPVILAGDFNAEFGSGTIEGLQELGYRVQESNWVDHVLTLGFGTAEATSIIRGTGSDHRGIRVTWGEIAETNE